MKHIKVIINSVDVSSYVVSVKNSSTDGEAISEFRVDLNLNVENAVSISTALDVEIYMDDTSPATTRIFDGYIDSYINQTDTIVIFCKDELAKLINKEITYYYDSSIPGNPAYPDGKISDIFIDIVENSGLSTNSGATVQDSGTEITLQKFVCLHADPFERCRKLAESLNWVFYYNSIDGYVYFEPKNTTVNSNVLTVGTNVINIPDWEYSRTEMINDLRIEGAQQLVQISEVFTGDASTTTFTLTYNPVDITVYYSATKDYTSASYLQTENLIGNITNSIDAHDYEVDIKNKTVTFISLVPAASANNILINYSYYVPIPVHLTNEASIAAYGTYAKTITLTDVLGFGDAWKRGQNILAKYSNPFRSTKIKYLYLGSTEPKVGEQIKVVDNVSSPNIDDYFTIYKHSNNYPDIYNEIEIGDKQYSIEEYNANIIERVKRLEESIIGSSDNVSEIVQNELLFDLISETTTVTAEMINDSFILDSPINGVLHDADKAMTLDDFEDNTDWSGTNCVLSDDSTVGHYQVGTQGVKVTYAGAVTASLNSTITSVDMTNVTGVATSTPSTGTLGLWVYCSDASTISNVQLQIGNDSSNYSEYTFETYGYRNSLYASNALEDGLNYLVFDLNNPDSETGTTTWNAIDYVNIIITTSGASDCTLDYFTASIDNNIGLNGLGDRATTLEETIYTW